MLVVSSGVRSRDAAKHPTVRWTVPPATLRDYLALYVSSAGVEKSVIATHVILKKYCLP